MIEKLQHRYALSERGAKDLVQGVIACTVQNIAFMFPVSLLYFFVGDLLDGGIHGSRIAFYVVGALFCLALIYGLMAVVAAGVLPIEQVANKNLALVAQTIFPNWLYVIFIIGGAVFAIATSLISGIAMMRLPGNAGCTGRLAT